MKLPIDWAQEKYDAVRFYDADGKCLSMPEYAYELCDALNSAAALKEENERLNGILCLVSGFALDLDDESYNLMLLKKIKRICAENIAKLALEPTP